MRLNYAFTLLSVVMICILILAKAPSWTWIVLLSILLIDILISLFIVIFGSAFKDKFITNKSGKITRYKGVHQIGNKVVNLKNLNKSPAVQYPMLRANLNTAYVNPSHFSSFEKAFPNGLPGKLPEDLSSRVATRASTVHRPH